ncbi:alpha-glucan family phosphorylase [Pseudomonas oligotrophica]|uniref:alpha-glucan family phosphorylase n=1 Tax=Pseudomonas oligotrophica TaxID=2912055 RepID=UPI001F320C14|nr:alpha-glucan family phosphorylase [Pseudomonas oligotrophica]MCF7200891.1 alpha-glucan family phosphorylase [Pseudomonas oligotrophica]
MATPRPSVSPATLRALAFDLSIRWNSQNDDIWQLIDEPLWELTHNPCLVLDSVPQATLERLLRRDDFRLRVEALADWQQRRFAEPGWFAGQASGALTRVAYFSMEYMLSEALPIYSGGLGNVAGDQLKAASDLGVPVVAVGMLWQHGYFRQGIDGDGRQQALYPVNDTRQLPVEPLTDPAGQPLRLTFNLPGMRLWIRGWQARVGRCRLLLLDTNEPANPPQVRLITSQLYGGDAEMRLRQEIVLGIGGWRLLEAAGLAPEVCHLNDGHAAFAVLERARCYRASRGVPFEVALAATRAGNLFTTHTPVEAGFDRFAAARVSQYLGRYAEAELGISRAELLELGGAAAGDPQASFNMACLATRGSGAVNAVSRLHEATSRFIFRGLFPRWPLAELPIGHVTNGVHLPTWLSADAEEHWFELYGAEIPWRGGEAVVAELLAQVDDRWLWQIRQRARRELLAFVCAHLARSLAMHGATPETIGAAGCGLDPERLTIGFARRFAAYKRPNLLLHDPDRLARLLGDANRPVQLLVAGKAHPADHAGQALLAEWQRFIARPDVAGRVVFLEDYDMHLARQLVQGVDVWINTPRRPWEASGTSGMKVLANGGLNLSQLDGWWAEAYAPGLGWAIGDGLEHGEGHDVVDAEQLYTVLEQEVVAEFYARDARGLPHAWVQRIRRSMGELVQRFSADRVVREYTERFYLPAATAYRARSGAGSAQAYALAGRIQRLRRHWAGLAFGRVELQRRGERYQVAVELQLGRLRSDDLAVQLYAEAVDGWPQESVALEPRGGSGPHWLFCAEIAASRPAEHYSARVIPAAYDGLLLPLELPLILWQR